MLCSSCTQIQIAILRRTGRPVLRAAWEEERLERLICARCGAVLPEQDSAEPLLDKLGQLSRFGLASGYRPLLRVRDPTTDMESSHVRSPGICR